MKPEQVNETHNKDTDSFVEKIKSAFEQSAAAGESGKQNEIGQWVDRKNKPNLGKMYIEL